MDTTYTYTTQNSSSRRVAIALALASAVVLSPLYTTTKTPKNHRHYDTRWGSGLFVVPMVLAGLIIAIKTTSTSTTSSSSLYNDWRGKELVSSDEASWVLRIGSSSWGLAGVLVMLMIVLSCQDTVQHFFWR